jgi:diguanylate cyclase (GGDEF)-like protein
MFKLLRYFSLTSFVSVIAVSIVLGVLDHEIDVRELIVQGETNNTAVGRVLANSLWPVLSPYLATANGMPANQLAAHPGLSELAAAIKANIQGISVVRVKIYDLRGRTLFSTDPKQIGEESPGDLRFQKARDGSVASGIVRVRELNVFDKLIEDRDLLSTFLPIRSDGDGPIVAVFEIFDDVTPFLEHADQTQWFVIFGVMMLLCGLYSVLYFIVRHADGEIHKQYRQREAAERALRQAHATLERRVEERTMDLARANAGLEAEYAERRLADQRVVHMAHHDALTGLPNRTLLADRVSQAIAHARGHGGKVAVLFLDLDRFKNVNDSLGHAVGDMLLTAVAGRLTACLRDGDTAARLGGDEFIVSLPNVGSHIEAANVASRILSDLAKPFKIAGHQLHADGSIGIAIYPTDGDTAETLLRNADTAMYHAKDSGRANFQFFSTQMTERVTRRLSTETQLRRALERGEFIMYYQPVIDLATARIDGAEALLRWPQPDQRVVSPGEFIPIAEDTGLIVPLGEWVLLEACAQAQAWQARHPGLRISVNLSPRQFRQKDLIGMIERALGETQLAPALLELELTESLLMHHSEETLGILRTLAEMGVRLAIDDFGTGYSSLSYLKRFPIHTVKIDHSFVRDITSDPDDAAIATAIVAMARSLNLEVTAEGVEHEEQVSFLRSLACNRVQGFYYGRPMAAAEFANRLGGVVTPQRLRSVA